MRTDYKYALASPSSNSAKKKLLYWSGIVLIIAAANFGFVHFFLNNPSIVGDGVEGLQIETIDTPRPIAPNQSLESQRFTQDEVEALGYTVPLSTDDAGSELLSAEAIENTALFPDLYDVLLVPENLEQPASTHPHLSEAVWKMVKVAPGDTTAAIFQDLNLNPAELAQILDLGFTTKALQMLHPGQVLRFLVDEDNRIVELVYNMNTNQSLVIKRSEEGFQAEIERRPLEQRNVHSKATINSSLAEAGSAAQISNKLLNQLASIYGWDIDFSKDIRKGDKFELVYQAFYDDGKKVATGNILAARFINKGVAHDAIRFVGANGQVGYYTPEGKSLQRSFLRTPVEHARISSRFSPARKHPVLHKIRAHKGVDYAAPTGTPIRATSNGVVSYVGWRGGYGRTIMVKHDGTYSTLYGHMSRYVKNLKKGSKIAQGQVIGYVGSSGLASGPHVHYEVRKNNKQIDPLNSRLPQTISLDKQYMQAFKAQSKEMLALLNAGEGADALINQEEMTDIS